MRERGIFQRIAEDFLAFCSLQSRYSVVLGDVYIVRENGRGAVSYDQLASSTIFYVDCYTHMLKQAHL